MWASMTHLRGCVLHRYWIDFLGARGIVTFATSLNPALIACFRIGVKTCFTTYKNSTLKGE